MLAVIKHAVDTISFSFSNTTHQRTAPGACNTVQLLQCKTSFLPQLYDPSSPYMNSTDYSTRSAESYGLMSMNCKPAISQKSNSKWLNSGKPLAQHLKGAIFAFLCLRWENKPSFDGILVQHVCQKLLKSVDVHCSYSVQNSCRFLRKSANKIGNFLTYHTSCYRRQFQSFQLSKTVRFFGAHPV